MDFLVEFDKCAFEFWQAFTSLSHAERRRLAGSEVYPRLFQTCFNVKQALQEPLLTGFPDSKSYSALASHRVHWSDSDSDESS